MMRHWPGVAVGILAITLTGASAPSQGTPGRATTISVLATQAEDPTPVTGLRQQDFEVRVDGAPVAIQSLSASGGRLAAVVLLDCTWTMSVIMAPFIVREGVDPRDIPLTAPVEGTRPPHRPLDLFLEPIRRGLLRHLQSSDRIRFATISRQIRLSPGFRSERAALELDAREALRIPDDDRYGPSPIWDGVDAAVTALEPEPGQRAIILVTDGFSTGNRHGLAEVTRRAALAGVAVYVVEQSSAPSGPFGRFVDLTDNPWILLAPLRGQGPGATLAGLSTATGGVYAAEPPPASRARSIPARDLAARFETALGQLHRTYCIRFEDSCTDGSVHGIDVRVKAAGVRAHAPALWRSGRTQ
jgi:hypothetical protein